MQGIGHTIPPYPGQTRQVGAGGGCRSCCSISPHPHSHRLDIASGSAPSLTWGHRFFCSRYVPQSRSFSPAGQRYKGRWSRDCISLSQSPWRARNGSHHAGGERSAMPRSGMGEEPVLERRESPFALLCGCRQYERLWGKSSSLVPAKIMKKSLFSSFFSQPGAAPQSAGRRRQRPERAVRSVWAS